MHNHLLTGVWRIMLEVPPMLWQKKIVKGKAKVKKSTAFMSLEHRRVHHFVVRELPRTGKPLSPDKVSQALSLPLEKTISILKDLEEHLTFLFRNEQGEVIWAYPVTIEKTPHRITFSSGEHLYAA
jgi:hypothetical protein